MRDIFISVIIEFLLNQLMYSIKSLEPLYMIQKKIFRLLPYISLFHGQLAFFTIAVKNARCRRLPNKLYDIICHLTQRDPCCGKITQYHR